MMKNLEDNDLSNACIIPKQYSITNGYLKQERIANCSWFAKGGAPCLTKAITCREQVACKSKNIYYHQEI